MNSNRITPSSLAYIGQLPSLTELKLENNQLTELSGIGRLTNLDNNRLSKIPTEIGNLVNLGTLSLSNNWLTELPAEISLLSKLAVLYLSNNLLTKLPAEMGNLQNLRYISLVNCPI